MTIDTIIRQGNLIDGQQQIDIAIDKGKIVEIGKELKINSRQTIDAKGCLISPPFIDTHFHLDAALSLGNPRMNESGTLLEGIQLWGELRPLLTAEEVKKRALAMCRWSIAQGIQAIRSHVDITDSRLITVEALLEVKKEIAPWLTLQLVAFPQDGLYRSEGAEKNLLKAIDMGVEVVGGIPHFERTMSEGTRSITTLCELAADRGLLVDMHCDESDDPLSRHIEALTYETHRLGLQGRVTGSHLTSMHSMDNYYVSKLLPLMAEADVNVVANPLINISLQGRHDNYPKRRGMTRIREMRDFDINVSLGHDCVMDPWYSLGSHDMLAVANMAIHSQQMTALEEMRYMYETITTHSAKVMQLDGYGIQKGNDANIIILQASNSIEAIRLKATRLYVLRCGEIVAQAKPLVSHLDLNGNTFEVDFRKTTNN
jgi:cytosine deaminase